MDLRSTVSDTAAYAGVGALVGTPAAATTCTAARSRPGSRPTTADGGGLPTKLRLNPICR